MMEPTEYVSIEEMKKRAAAAERLKRLKEAKTNSEELAAARRLAAQERNTKPVEVVVR